MDDDYYREQQRRYDEMRRQAQREEDARRRRQEEQRRDEEARRRREEANRRADAERDRLRDENRRKDAQKAADRLAEHQREDAAAERKKNEETNKRVGDLIRSGNTRAAAALWGIDLPLEPSPARAPAPKPVRVPVPKPATPALLRSFLSTLGDLSLKFVKEQASLAALEAQFRKIHDLILHVIFVPRNGPDWFEKEFKRLAAEALFAGVCRDGLRAVFERYKAENLFVALFGRAEAVESAINEFEWMRAEHVREYGPFGRVSW